MKMHILLLEDDRVLAETVQEVLMDEGYACYVAHTGESALEASYQTKFDLYLLDINVPGILGTTLLKELRHAGDTTPAVFITSKADESSIVEGYRIGCDDYLRKPFSLIELKVRLNAVLKRVYGFNETTISLGDNLTFDLASLSLLQESETLSLPKKEALILAFFIKNQGRIVTKDELISAIWEDSFPSDAVIRVHISGIKKLIGSERLTTIKGMGYRFEKL